MSTVVRQQTTESTQLFPMSVTSEQTSLNYMKRLTAVAISNILYLRNVFSEECYGHRKLDHLKLRILSERSDTTGAKQIVQWVKGCFDAMEKKYLKQLTLGIYTDPTDPDELIEAYTFRFAYESNQLNISLNKNRNERVISTEDSNKELRHSTVQLLRSIVIMVQSLDKLPKDCFLTMKLLYYDDITPEDYEPPGFKAADKETFTFKGKPISISAGEVVTAYHSLKVKIRTNQEQFQDFDTTPPSDINESQNKSQELIDECTPLAIEGETDADKASPDLRQTMSSRNNCNVLSENSGKTQSKTNDNSTKKNTKSVVNESIAWSRQSSKESVLSSLSLKSQHLNESVISKIKDMKMEDNEQYDCETEANEAHKRKVDFEVTQDSVFSALSPNRKRFKSSKTNKTIPIRKSR